MRKAWFIRDTRNGGFDKLVSYEEARQLQTAGKLVELYAFDCGKDLPCFGPVENGRFVKFTEEVK